MKVLVATGQTQGWKSTDFCFVPEGELVTFPTFECDSACSCGCSRAMVGLECLKGTTTFAVAEREDIDSVGTLARLLESWFVEHRPFVDSEVVAEGALGDAEVIAALCAPYPVGTVFERIPLHRYVLEPERFVLRAMPEQVGGPQPVYSEETERSWAPETVSGPMGTSLMARVCESWEGGRWEPRVSLLGSNVKELRAALLGAGRKGAV